MKKVFSRLFHISTDLLSWNLPFLLTVTTAIIIMITTNFGKVTSDNHSHRYYQQGVYSTAGHHYTAPPQFQKPLTDYNYYNYLKSPSNPNVYSYVTGTPQMFTRIPQSSSSIADGSGHVSRNTYPPTISRRQFQVSNRQEMVPESNEMGQSEVPMREMPPKPEEGQGNSMPEGNAPGENGMKENSETSGENGMKENSETPGENGMKESPEELSPFEQALKDLTTPERLIPIINNLTFIALVILHLPAVIPLVMIPLAFFCVGTILIPIVRVNYFITHKDDGEDGRRSLMSSWITNSNIFDNLF